MTAPPGGAAIDGDDLDVRRPTVDANRASPRPPRARDAHLFRRRVAFALVSFTFVFRRPRVLVRPRLNTATAFHIFPRGFSRFWREDDRTLARARWSERLKLTGPGATREAARGPRARAARRDEDARS
jgi:hypothetical protein